MFSGRKILRRSLGVLAAFFSILVGFRSGSVAAADGGKEAFVGIEERLGEKIPMDLILRDEKGEPISLSSLFAGKPVLLELVYYECPGICTPFLQSTAELLEEVPAVPGKDFTAVAVSISPSETAAVAARKKREIFGGMRRAVSRDGWRFLTGETEPVRRLAEAVGFRYRENGSGFLHTTALIVLSPGGKITRYIYGKNFLAADLQLALVEASEGRVGPTVARVLRYCFNYDPAGDRYVLDVKKVAGAAVSLGGLFLLGTLLLTGRREEKRPRRRQTSGADGEIDGNEEGREK